MDEAETAPAPVRTPWHLWVVGVLALLWNASGAYTIMMAQAGRLPNLSADEIEYYATQPLWFVLVSDIALIGAVAGAVAILFKRRFAVWLFGVSLVAIAITDVYDLGTGMSRALVTTAAMIVTALIFVLAVLELWYAFAMSKRGVLR